MSQLATEAPRTFEIDGLLAEIPGADPSGDPHAYAYGLRERLGELRIEERPEDFDDATRPEKLKKADWSAVLKVADEALREQSKDLRIACHVVEAVTKLFGFAGLRDGLILVRRLVDECWDFLLPDIDDGDLDNRAAPLANMLDDPIRGICFPNAVRMIGLLGESGDSLSYLDWDRLRTSHDTKDREALASVVASTPPERLQQTAAEIEQCLDELKQTLPVFDARMGAVAPGLTKLRAALEDCQRLVREQNSHNATASPTGEPAGGVEASTAGATEAAGVSNSAGNVGRAVASRADAYAQLAHAAALLQELEPHSPIPYLVNRAVALGGMPFPQLMQQLIRDGGILETMNRELGISPAAEGGA